MNVELIKRVAEHFRVVSIVICFMLASLRRRLCLLLINNQVSFTKLNFHFFNARLHNDVAILVLITNKYLSGLFGLFELFFVYLDCS